MRSRTLVCWMSIALFGAALVMAPDRVFRHTPTLGVSHSFARQFIQGNLVGWHSGPNLSLDVHLAEPGDVILCHNAHGAYGYWTHAVLYAGQEQVVDANDFAHGTILQDVSHYRGYDEVALFRPKLPVNLRRQAANVARSRIGTPYDPLSSLRDAHSSYCSKLIWEAYAKVGVPLCNSSGWVLPDQIATSPMMTRIASWDAGQGDSGHVDAEQSVY